MKKFLRFAVALILVMTTFFACLPTTAFAAVGDNSYEEAEYNNSLSTANIIYNDYTVFGHCGYSDIDYFYLYIASDSTVEITIVGENSHLLTGLCDSTGESIAAVCTSYSDGNYNATLTKFVPAGIYYIGFVNDTGYANDYAFYVEVNRNNVYVENEPNNSITTSNIVYNDYIVSGYCDYSDIDYFYLYVASPSTVEVTIAGENSYLLMALCDNTGEVITATRTSYSHGNYGATLTEHISAGIYYIGLVNDTGYANDYAFYVEVKSNNNYGWQLLNGKWFYFDKSGKMVSDCWKKDNFGWCYLGRDGYMLTNAWVKDSVGWCYVGADGYCVTNAWKKDSHGWCYLDSEGRMATDRWVMDSVGWCYVGADGYCVTNAWKRDSYGWCYLDSEGRMATNRWVMDSVGWCYVGADGYAVTNCWKKDSVGWCYLDSEGSMVKNNWVYDAGWYYLDGNGYMVTGWQSIDSVWYNFASSGVRIG